VLLAFIGQDDLLTSLRFQGVHHVVLDVHEGDVVA